MDTKETKLRKIIREELKKQLKEDHLTSRDEQIEYICSSLQSCTDENIQKVYEFIEQLQGK